MLARLATESDRGVLHLLAREMTETYRPNLVYDEEIANRTFDSYLRMANPTFFVAEENREVVGFLLAMTSRFLFSSGEIASQEVFYVRPDKRGTRAAASLADIFNQWADRLAVSEVHMGVATGHRAEVAARFMRAYGFSPVGQYLYRDCGGANVERR